MPSATPSLRSMHILFAIGCALLIATIAGAFMQDASRRALPASSAQPAARITQIALKDLPLKNGVPRVDRCVSCHSTIDDRDAKYRERDAAKLEPALRSHPRLDLFVAADSKHPYSRFGCSICHQGQPTGTSFARAAHSPQNAEQFQAWTKQYGWSPVESCETPMLPLQYSEASCLQCHRGLDEVPGAAKLNAGRKMFGQFGCADCHAAGDDFAWVGRVGPDLSHIREKTDIVWIRQWIENPRAFRPGTRMPQPVNLENRGDLFIDVSAHHLKRDPIEVEAMSVFLIAAGTTRQYSLPYSDSEDRAAGRKLFMTLGCAACHSTSEAQDADRIALSSHGSDLSRCGDKLRGEWLVEWLVRPHFYWRETKMPELRLNVKDANQIASFLMSLRVGVRPPVSPQAPEAAFESILRERGVDLKSEEPRAKSRLAGIEKTVANLQGDSRTVKAYLAGELLVQHYNCNACHRVPGIADASKPGPSLAGVGEKSLERFDFGKNGERKIAHTRWDWLREKLTRPRSFDVGRLEARKPFERLRMPAFAFTPKQLDALVTHLLSLTGADNVPASMRVHPSAQVVIRDRGRRVLSELNCIGCHVVGPDGTIHSPLMNVLADNGVAREKIPPNLTGEGAKTRAEWLYGFLRNVKPVRPALVVRMPDFWSSAPDLYVVGRLPISPGAHDLDDAAQLVDYFQTEANQPRYETPLATADAQARNDGKRCVSESVEKGGAGCAACHPSRAPDLALASQRLKPAWVQTYLSGKNQCSIRANDENKAARCRDAILKYLTQP